MPHSPTRPVLGDQDLGVLESCSQKLSAHHSAFPRGGVISTWKNDLDREPFWWVKTCRQRPGSHRKLEKELSSLSMAPHLIPTPKAHTSAIQGLARPQSMLSPA